MPIDHIVYLDDLLRKDFLHSRGFVYGCIAEPVRQAVGVRVPDPSRFPSDRGLDPAFDLTRFTAMCPPTWQAAYQRIPPDAEDYLLAHIPQTSLVIGYEMPPWLRSMLDRAGLPRVELRLSPVRFARDLLFAVNARTVTSSFDAEWSKRVELKVRIDAGLMRAAVQHNAPINHRRTGDAKRVVFVGQTASDASLIDDNGQLVRIERYADRLRALAAESQLAYAPHPYAGKYAREEHGRLRHLLGQKVPIERAPLYNLMAGREQIDFVSISSGAIQEAAFFSQAAELLFRAICPIDSDKADNYRLATFSDVTSPTYWRACLAGTNYTGFDGPMPENLMRRLHNAWWGYADYFIDNDSFWRRVITRGVRNIFNRARGR
jgi:hypothetical protein